jgi:hypothetical protein
VVLAQFQFLFETHTTRIRFNLFRKGTGLPWAAEKALTHSSFWVAQRFSAAVKALF